MTKAPFGRPAPNLPKAPPTEELVALQRKLAKRIDQPGYAANVADIQARIAELEAEIKAV